jgi:hypothetical protein
MGKTWRLVGVVRDVLKGPTGRGFLVTETCFSRAAGPEEWWKATAAAQPDVAPVGP